MSGHLPQKTSLRELVKERGLNFWTWEFLEHLYKFQAFFLLGADSRWRAMRARKSSSISLFIFFLVMTSSTSDLEIAQQYSLHRLYQTRKTIVNSGSTNHSINGTKYGSTANGMSHSQSTGDVSAIFGRAWQHPTVKFSNFDDSSDLL